MKKRKLIFLLPIAAMALGACGNKEEPKDGPGQQEEGGGGGGEQETVSLAIKNKENFELEVGAENQLEAELKGTTGTPVWSSSAEAVARVDQTGKVTAVAVGSATITVSFEGKTDSVEVTVKEHEDEVIHVQSIKKNVSQYSVEIGATATIGATFTPENATDQGLIFELSKEGIVSISEDGTVTGLAEGSVDITVKSHDNPSATFTITGFKVVAPAVEVPTSTASGYQMVESGALTDGDYVQFIAEFGGHIYGMKKYASGNNVKTIELSVSDEVLDDSATDGIFVIVKNDDGTYSFKDSDDKYLDACGGNGSNYLKVTDSIKSTSKFNVTIVDGKATIVCADQNTGRGHLYLNGSATCFSCYADKTGDSGYPLVSLFTKTPVVVHADGVTLDQETLSFEVGDVPKTLVATVSPAEAVNKEVTWSSSAPEVATVVNGVVTALAVGTTTITVTTVDGGLTDTCEVTVAEATRVMTGITIEGLTNTVYTEGDAFDLAGLIVKAIYDKGEPAVITEGFEPSIAAGTLLTTSDTSFTVTYNSLTSNAITLTVNEKQPIVAEGTYVIKHTRESVTYYMTSETASGGQPIATTDPTKAAVFDFELKQDTKDTYTIKLHGESKYLALGKKDNNGVRISSSEFEWKITEGTRTGGGFDLSGVYSEETRYLTLYVNGDTKDFRCYTTPDATNRKENTELMSVVAKDVSSIAIKQNPTKMTYYVGEAFDPTGMIVTVNYSDSSSEDITEGFTYECKTGFQAVAADRNVKITYKSKTANVEHVTVVEDDRTIDSIKIDETSALAKTSYNAGDLWEATGVKVIGVRNDMTEVELKSDVAFTFDTEKAAVGVTQLEVTATYNNGSKDLTASKTFDVTVIDTSTTTVKTFKSSADTFGVGTDTTARTYDDINGIAIAVAGLKNGSGADKNYGYFMLNNGYIASTSAPSGMYISKVVVTYTAGTGESGKIITTLTSSAMVQKSDVGADSGNELLNAVKKSGTYTVENTDDSLIYFNVSNVTTSNAQIATIEVTYSAK